MGEPCLPRAQAGFASLCHYGGQAPVGPLGWGPGPQTPWCWGAASLRSPFLDLRSGGLWAASLRSPFLDLRSGGLRVASLRSPFLDLRSGGLRAASLRSPFWICDRVGFGWL